MYFCKVVFYRQKKNWLYACKHKNDDNSTSQVYEPPDCNEPLRWWRALKIKS